MKILLVNKYHYFRGGSETYYFGLADALRRAGHEVIFFSMKDKRNLPCKQSRYFVSNIEFNGDLSLKEKVRAGSRMIYSLEAKRKMERLIRDERPDIVHINLFHRVLTASVVDAAKKYGIPVVFTMHDLNCICPNHTMLDHGKVCEKCLHGNYLYCVKNVCFKDSRAKCAMAAAESAFNRMSGLYNKIDAYITPSAFYKKKLIESGITEKPVIHMKNFLPEGTEYGWKGIRGDYLLYYGRLSEEKGIMTLIEAVRFMPGISLKIVGTGPEEGKIRRKIREYGLENRVAMEGFKSGDELLKYIDEAKCVVVPSEWYEASGYTACEAQARGKIVIASDMGGLPENIKDGVTGFVYHADCEDRVSTRISCMTAIQKVYVMDKRWHRKMSENAVKNAERMFSCTVYINRLERLYKKLIEKNRSRLDGLYHDMVQGDELRKRPAGIRTAEIHTKPGIQLPDPELCPRKTGVTENEDIKRQPEGYAHL